MTWWKPWTWRRRPVNGRESTRALREARRKLDDAKARRPEVQRVTNDFSDAVEAALARRRR